MVKYEDSSVVLQKIEHFCAYQERCCYEVALKLKSWNIDPARIPSILQMLQEELFINEERYARAFVRGKFHFNKWGRLKIINELRSRQIEDRIINLAINEIAADEYQQVLKSLVLLKFKEIKPGINLNIREKILTFVTGKGYEYNLAEKIVNELIIKNDSP